MCSTDHLSDSNQTHLHVQSSTQKSSMQASNGYTSFMFIILNICNLKHYFDSANKILLKNTHTHTNNNNNKDKTNTNITAFLDELMSIAYFLSTTFCTP